MDQANDKKLRRSRPSIREIARWAGVSPTTVSFVLNDRAAEFGIAEATCERIREVVRKHNYRQNIHGRAIMARKTFLVGVLVHSLVNSFWNQVIAGVSSELSAHGYHMLLAESKAENPQDSFEYMKQIGVDGIICAFNFSNVDTSTIKLPDYWYEQRVVNMLHPLPGIHSVFTDHVKGTEMVAEDLWQKGHRKVAFLGANHHDLNIRLNENLRVLREFYQSRGGEVLAFDTPGEVLANRDKFTAVFCRRDNDAENLYVAAYDAKLNIPEDISIAGYGGESLSPLMRPGLTTVFECKRDLGVVAARRLISEIENNTVGDSPEHLAMMPTFYAGGSVKDINQ